MHLLGLSEDQGKEFVLISNRLYNFLERGSNPHSVVGDLKLSRVLINGDLCYE
jgi:hypothetical protein